MNSVLMWVGFAFLALAGVRNYPVMSLSLPPLAVRQIAGTTLVAVGVAIAIWSRRVLGSNWSGIVRITEGQRLVTDGPYRVVRNPIYSGILLAAGGMALASCDIAALVGLALVFAGLWRKARVEESFLASEFGEQYADYARRVRSIIPFVL